MNELLSRIFHRALGEAVGLAFLILCIVLAIPIWITAALWFVIENMNFHKVWSVRFMEKLIGMSL